MYIWTPHPCTYLNKHIDLFYVTVLCITALVHDEYRDALSSFVTVTDVGSCWTSSVRHQGRRNNDHQSWRVAVLPIPTKPAGTQYHLFIALFFMPTGALFLPIFFVAVFHYCNSIFSLPYCYRFCTFSSCSECCFPFLFTPITTLVTIVSVLLLSCLLSTLLS